MAKSKPIWGSAHPTRGIKYDSIARQFVKQFPVGTTLTVLKFEKWARQFDTYGDSNSLRRLRYKINKASTHSRMGNDGFYVKCISHGNLSVKGQGSLVVRSIEDQIDTCDDLPKRAKSFMQSLLNTQKYCLQQLNLRRISKNEHDAYKMVWINCEQTAKAVSLYLEGLERLLDVGKARLPEIDNGDAGLLV